MSQLVDKRRIDVVGAFLIFISTVGSVERTALACDLSEDTIRALAESENWNAKIKSITLASKAGGLQANEFAILQNRALAWCQGHRLRQVLDRVVVNLHEQTTDELMASITTTDKDGNSKLNARLFADLAKSLEVVNGICWAALSDTIPERKAATPDAAASTAAVHASLIAALNGPGVKGKSSEDLVAQVTQAAEAIAEGVPVEPLVERKKLAAPSSEVKPLETPPTQ